MPPPGDAGGADRFVWNIEAHCGPQQKQAELPDREVQGPWRELVDQVRSFGAARRAARRAGRTGTARRPATAPRPRGSAREELALLLRLEVLLQ